MDPTIDNSYRYYHCYEEFLDRLKCKRVDGPSVLPEHENTKLLFVKKYIPEKMDGPILKYKWMPAKIIIEGK